ncbi:MAG: SPOR domain-containing protein [Pseudomonadota bacterium]
MNQAMKQRLIGTIVLACLALIFIPIFLDGEGVQDPTPLTVNVPPAPEIIVTPLPDPVRPVILSDTDALNINNTTAPDPDLLPQAPVIEPAEGVDTSESLTAEQTNVPPPEPEAAPEADSIAVTKPELNTQGVPQGWSVKLGTFSDRTNAESLVASLILENYKAYSRPVQSGSQTMLAVYVGPVLTKDEASILQARLKNDQQQKDAVVVPFIIDPPAQGQ